MDKKIVLITGATSGIGYASALKFAKKGYNVIMHSRSKTLNEDFALDFVQADFSKADEISEMFDEIKKKQSK